MRVSGGRNGFIGLAAVAALLAFAACRQAPAAAAAGTYEDALRAMEGEEFEKATGTISGEWKFEVASSWEGDRPSPEDLRMFLQKKIRFTDEEIGSVFSQNGRYRILVFTKKTGSEQASVGSVDSMGMAVGKDLGAEIEKFDLIRVAFRDGRLVQGRIWTNMERAGRTSGGVVRRRN